MTSMTTRWLAATELRWLLGFAIGLSIAAGCRDRPVTEPPRCGDGRVDPGELCDDGAGNSDDAPGACRTDCAPARCGDGVADSSEACDGTDLGGASCTSLEYYGGDLDCRADCAFDVASCESAGWCGDGIVQASEECDDGNGEEEDGCSGCQITVFIVPPPEGYTNFSHPVVAIDSTGMVTVAWGAVWAGPREPSMTIVFRDVWPSGAIFSPPGILMHTDDPQFPAQYGFVQPDIARASGNRCLFVFQDCCEDIPVEFPVDGSETAVFRAERIGAERSYPTVVNTFTDGRQGRPRLTALFSGESVVVWQSGGQDASGWGVFAQPYSRDGTPVGPETVVNEATEGHQIAPDVAMLDDGGFVVVWESSDESGSSLGVLLRRFDLQGVPLGPEAMVSDAAIVDPGQRAPRVAAGGGGFVVVWQAWEQDGDGWGIVGRKFFADGSAGSGDLILSQSVLDDQENPAVAVDGSGSFVAVWEDHSSGEWNTRMRRFDPNGHPRGDETTVGRSAPNGGRHPQVAMTPDGRFIIAGAGSLIHAQRFLPDGTPIGLAPW